jgi:hypothetical protein
LELDFSFTSYFGRENKMKKIFMFLLMSMLLISMVSAWMPETHTYQMEKALEQAPSSPVGLVIQNNFDDYIAGNILTDASVFYYFSEGFTNIGKEYKATHSAVLCKRAVELASNDQELAFAYGICAHHVEDAVSHNDFVPNVVEKTKMPNGIVHALAEEDVNDNIATDELRSRVRSALVNRAPVHREFYIKVLQSNEDVSIDVGKLYDAFVFEVAGNSKYSVGFRSFTAVPMSIHVVLILLFILSLVSMATLVRREKKSIFNKISIVILTGIALLIVFIYVLYFTGTLWQFFQFASTPLTSVLPTGGWEQYVDKSVSETVKMMNGGANYVNSIRDPSGEESLARASASGSVFRIIIDILIVGLIALFIWLNFRRKKR